MLRKFIGPCLSAAFLAACSGSNGGLVPSTAMHGASIQHGANVRRAQSAGYQILHSFGASGDGSEPLAGLAVLGGALYGTTVSGGAHSDGTVFNISTGGTETVLHNFAGGHGDGENPYARVTPLGGALYGTTYQGGSYGGGTAFSITTGGTETLLYSFGKCQRGHPFPFCDAGLPVTALVDLNGLLYGTSTRGALNDCCPEVFSLAKNGSESVLSAWGGYGNLSELVALNGVLYGTTTAGGANGQGTVLSITTSGTISVLHSFGGSGRDGSNPEAGLAVVNGVLYGTTQSGGANNAGTVFSITTSGTETVLYSFGASGDGTSPVAKLYPSSGVLYGTTQSGGANNAGTVFSVTTSGTETVLHSFGASGDGANPVADLCAINGELYGTTSAGGAYNAGTVFALPIPGIENVIHSFGASGDGNDPVAPLLNIGGALYGTTVYGGASNGGTAYSITPYGETVLHSFTGSPDGQNPYAGLVTHNGTLLFGTTPSGGAYNDGTIYSITGSGAENVLESFYSGSDGQNPVGGLIVVSGMLYGTTAGGGLYNAGTSFSMTNANGETVLSSFGGGSGRGTNPRAPLLNRGGMLYGTTASGGAYNSGTVFAISRTTGQQALLHSFGGGSGDGANPEYGQLVTLNSTMYGTTLNGGANGQGTIYSITTGGAETVIHSFAGGSGDGSNPYGGLVVVNNNTLYGTTSGGGAYGQGTLFSITASGTFNVLWSFGSQYDGARPQAGLIYSTNGLLYGTTTQGGTYGGGTVFSLSL